MKEGDKSIKLVVPGRCYTKNSYAGKFGYGRKGKDYARAKDWEKRARILYEITLRKQGSWIIKNNEQCPPFGKNPVSLYVTIYLQGKKRADLTNYLKSICDSMNNLIYVDDKQITFECSQILQVANKEDERIEIKIVPSDSKG